MNKSLVVIGYTHRHDNYKFIQPDPSESPSSIHILHFDCTGIFRYRTISAPSSNSVRSASIRCRPHRYLSIPHRLSSILQHRPFRLDPITPQPGQQLGPDGPVYHSEQQNTDSDDWEDVIRIPVRATPTFRGDKRHHGQEDVG